MLQRPSDAGKDTVAEQLDEAIDEPAPGQDAGIETDGGKDGAVAVDSLAFGADSADTGPLIVPIRSQKVTGNTRLNFGSKVAVSGDTLAIGSEASNRVRFFDRTINGWTESAVLDLPPVAPYSSAVSALAMDGDLAAVGTTGVVETKPGWVHVLRRTAGVWTVETRIDDPAADSMSLFGCSAGVSAGTIVVGADRNYDGNPGSAYVFVNGPSGWARQATLTGSADGTPTTELGNDKFGYSVAISADAIAVVRLFSRHPGALLFRRDSGVWQRDPRFQPDTSLFGQPISVALYGESLIIGDNARELGFVYRNSGDSGWTLEDKLTARPESNLGYSVALTGRLAVTGGLGRSERSDHGNVYAFVRSEARWSAPIALLPQDEPPPAGFGWPVAASGTTIVVGAQFATEGGVEMGAAYVFDFDLSGVH
jgi:hypothetical protein